MNEIQSFNMMVTNLSDQISRLEMILPDIPKHINVFDEDNLADISFLKENLADMGETVDNIYTLLTSIRLKMDGLTAIGKRLK